MMTRLQSAYDVEIPGLTNKIRVHLEALEVEIKGFLLSPLDGSSGFCRSFDKFDDDIVPGTKCRSTTGEVHYTVVQVKDAVKKLVVKNEKGVESEVSLVQLRYDEHEATSMIADITRMGAERGLRNLMHADRQPIIAAYAKGFAVHYYKKITDSIAKITKDIRSMLNSMHKAASVGTAIPASKRHREDMDEVLATCMIEANASALRIYAYNTEPDLIFDANGHYLHSLIKEMVAADPDMATDEGEKI